MNRIEGDVVITGTLYAQAQQLPASSVGNTEVKSTDPISAGKLQHQRKLTVAQPNTTATTETRTIFVATAAGTLKSFEAGSIAACAGAATITVNLLKNNVSVLSAAITLNSSSTNRVSQAGMILTADFVDGDWFEVVITATAGGGTIGTGLAASLTLNETAEP